MTERDFESALRGVDRAWSEETVSPRVERQLRRKLRGEEDPVASQRPVWWRFAAIAAVATLLVFWMARGTGEHLPRIAGFSVPTTCVGAHAEGEALVLEGDCALTTPRAGITVEVTGTAQIATIDDGVAVSRGRMTFDVEPRARRRRVAVSGGVIEILGTRFEVEEKGTSGSVHLVHGSIRFVGTGGRTVLLKPGESLRWPLDDAERMAAGVSPEAKGSDHEGEVPIVPEAPGAPSPTAPTAGPSSPAASARPHSTVRPSAAASASPSAAMPLRPRDLMAEVAKLRSQGRFEEAAELLREVGPLPAEDRERLSYERGSMLTYRLDQKEAACAHWAAHEAQFPDGTYAIEVSLAKRKLGCD